MQNQGSYFWVNPKKLMLEKQNDITYPLNIANIGNNGLIDEHQLESLNQAIKNKYNVDFPNYELRSLKRRVERAIYILGFNSINTLKDRILNDARFYKAYLNELTVDRTEMFRDPMIWRFLKKDILNELKKLPQITIWHAGCSKGQEIFTMAIVIAENNLSHKTKIYATDINKFSLEHAQTGKYDLKELLSYEKNYRLYQGFKELSSYYTHDYYQGQFHEFLFKNMTFFTHDLTYENFPDSCNLILCRYVMIYFNKELKQKVFRQFHEKLVCGGYLVIGLTDTMNHNLLAEKYECLSIEYKIFQKIKD